MSREKDKTNGYDPGIGTRFKLPTKRIINKDGSFNVVKEGARFRLNDAYLFFINLTWFQFILLILAGFITVNLLFACLYVSLGEGAFNTASKGDFTDRFLEAYYTSLLKPLPRSDTVPFHPVHTSLRSLLPLRPWWVFCPSHWLRDFSSDGSVNQGPSYSSVNTP